MILLKVPPSRAQKEKQLKAERDLKLALHRKVPQQFKSSDMHMFLLYVPYFSEHIKPSHSQVSQLERGLEDSRQQQLASRELRITTEDLKTLLLANPEVIDAATWVALAAKSQSVKSALGGYPGAEERREGERGEERDVGEENHGVGGIGEENHGVGGEVLVFRCEESKRCRQTFKTKTCLANHIKAYHTGTKNFVCAACGKQFITVKRLKKHEKIHLKADVICEICGVQKRDEYRMLQHKQQHHEEGRGTCSKCNVDCGTRASLRKHKKTCGKVRPVGRMQAQVVK